MTLIAVTCICYRGRGPSEEDDSSAISDSVASAELMQASPRHPCATDLLLTGLGSVKEASVVGGSVPALEQRDLMELIAELHESQQQYMKLRATVEGLKARIECLELLFVTSTCDT